MSFPETVVCDEATKTEYIKTAAYYVHLQNNNLTDVECWLEGERQIYKQYVFLSYATQTMSVDFVNKIQRYFKTSPPNPMTLTNNDHWIYSAPKLTTDATLLTERVDVSDCPLDVYATRLKNQNASCK